MGLLCLPFMESEHPPSKNINIYQHGGVFESQGQRILLSFLLSSMSA